ncbi:hypothetical protein AB0L65_57095 [Nonomuraea sp. NPDC052116]|uniref:hypothetical protein n=1 Tax=Nonomuraea sp. NPDC052116 TaxID=3155665 RepID=UPI00343E7C6B
MSRTESGGAFVTTTNAHRALTDVARHSAAAVWVWQSDGRLHTIITDESRAHSSCRSTRR